MIICIFAAVFTIINLNFTIMAKGNMLLGYARGKVGSLVFSRRKGEQITRARNFSPANPRTNAQLAQRMKMYAPVKLYRQSMERFFKYAFSLKEKETIFNGFMRENISIAPWTARELAVAQAPIPFPARMSSGSLGGFSVALSPSGEYADAALHVGGAGNSVIAVNIGSDDSDYTIADVSESFLSLHPQFMEGDQLTFVLVSTAGLSLEGGNVLYDESSSFIFKYAKLVLDKSDLRSVTDLGFVTSLVGSNSAEVGIQSSADFETDCVGGCVIVTRNVGGKVDATVTTLGLNDTASSFYNLMRTDSYRAKAAASYKASPDAYLNPATSVNE